jgi:HSP20 family protein
MLTIYKDPIRDIFENFFDTPTFVERNKTSNVTIGQDDYRIHLAVPGLSKDDIKISVKDSILTIMYEKEEKDDKTFSFIGSFKKTYTLPEDCDEKSINGSIENGVVEIIIPKSKKKSVERLISLN